MQRRACVTATLGAVLFVVLASSSSASAVPVIVCAPGLKELPAPVQQLCVALLEKENAPPDEGIVVGLRDLLPAQMYEHHPNDVRGIKRQDVDHVFLRFGRRNGGL